MSGQKHGQKGLLDGLKGLAVSARIINPTPEEATPAAPASPSSAAPVVLSGFTAVTSNGAVDQAMLAQMQTEVDRAATPAFHAFMEQLKGLSGLPGYTSAMAIAGAIATCRFPKGEILKGVQDRMAALDRIAQKFNSDVEAARRTQLGAADMELKRIEDQIEARRKGVSDQIQVLQQQMDALRASLDTEVGSLTAEKATKQAARDTLEHTLANSVAVFNATSDQLRKGLTTETAQLTAALSS